MLTSKLKRIIYHSIINLFWTTMTNDLLSIKIVSQRSTKISLSQIISKTIITEITELLSIILNTPHINILPLLTLTMKIWVLRSVLSEMEIPVKRNFLSLRKVLMLLASKVSCLSFSRKRLLWNKIQVKKKWSSNWIALRSKVYWLMITIPIMAKTLTLSTPTLHSNQNQRITIKSWWKDSPKILKNFRPNLSTFKKEFKLFAKRTENLIKGTHQVS